MIQSVSFEDTTFAPIPGRFEAGTPPVAQVIGLGAAIRYLEALDWTAVAEHEADLLRHASELLSGEPGIRMIGAARERVGVLSFVVEGVHPHDVGTILDLHGVAVRASHHCAQPLMKRFGIPGTVRAAFALYNTTEDVDRLVAGVREARKVFAG